MLKYSSGKKDDKSDALTQTFSKALNTWSSWTPLKADGIAHECLASETGFLKTSKLSTAKTVLEEMYAKRIASNHTESVQKAMDLQVDNISAFSKLCDLLQVRSGDVFFPISTATMPGQATKDMSAALDDIIGATSGPHVSEVVQIASTQSSLMKVHATALTLEAYARLSRAQSRVAVFVKACLLCGRTNSYCLLPARERDSLLTKAGAACEGIEKLESFVKAAIDAGNHPKQGDGVRENWERVEKASGLAASYRVIICSYSVSLTSHMSP